MATSRIAFRHRYPLLRDRALARVQSRRDSRRHLWPVPGSDLRLRPRLRRGHLGDLARNSWTLIEREPDWIDDQTLSDAALERPDNFLVCGLCNQSFIKQDMLTCPVSPTNAICSVCCASHSTCHDHCKRPPVFTISKDEVEGKQQRVDAARVPA